MHSSPSDRSDGSSGLIVEIIETLETCGVEDDSYQLYDYVDPNALEQLIASTDEHIAVRFTVEGILLEVSPDGVNVMIEDESHSGSE
jgi:hypothetical protein